MQSCQTLQLLHLVTLAKFLMRFVALLPICENLTLDLGVIQSASHSLPLQQAPENAQVSLLPCCCSRPG